MKNKKAIIRIKTDKENKCIILAIWILICAAAKYMLLEVLPAKYSRDGRSIFLQSQTGLERNDKGYDLAANFFSVANKIIRFSSFEDWSILLSIIGSAVLIYFIYDSLENLFLMEFVFLTSSIFLMNIYIFTVSKDIIQLLMFLPIVYVLCGQYRIKTKLIVVIASLLLTALFMRTYFVLTVIMFCAVYRTFYNSFYLENKKFWRNLGFILLFGIIALYFLKSNAPLIFEELSQARIGVNQYRIGDEDAQTMIINLIDDDGTIITFMLNLVINVFRLLFPVSMLREGVLQILFLAYQICLSGKLLLLFYNRSNEVQDENNFIAISLLIAYFIVAAVFEPDYGSAIRHEMAFFPIIYIAFFRGENYAKE